jgi:hypothetical protein
MCGRPNPPDQEVCRFCQARLKPLIASPFTGEGAPLKPAEPPVQKPTSDLESSLPDWLRDLRQKDEPEPDPEREETLPDWLAEEPEEPAPSGEAGMGDTSNWWSRISQEGETPGPERVEKPGESSDPFAPAFGAAEAFDQEPEGLLWAPSPEDAAGKAESFTQADKKEEEDLPDWLRTLGSDDFLRTSDRQEPPQLPPVPPPACAGR